MAYEKENDLLPIQSDVLTTDTSTNTDIKTKYKLKTTSKIITSAINELNSQLTSITATATEALNKTESIKEEIKEELSNENNNTSTSNSYTLNRDDFNASDENETIFKLTKQPVNYDTLQFFVNGLMAKKTDIIYDTENNTVTWIGQKTDSNPKGFDITSSDYITIIYMV